MRSSFPLLFISCLSCLLLIISCKPLESSNSQTSTHPEIAEEAKDHFSQSFIRIQSTIKAPLAHAPWQLPKPQNQYGMGVVLENGYILTSASMVANTSYIEISSSDDLIKEQAVVVACDYDSNLALLQSQLGTDSQLKSTGISLSQPITKDDTAQIWQLESQGETLTTTATFQKALMISTIGEVGSTLGYQFKASLQRSSNSFCLPVIKDEKLLGIMVSYRADEQRCTSVSLESIQRFIHTFENNGNYGLPLLGLNFKNTLSPTYRDWLKLPHDEQGIIVTKIIPNSPIEQAGIQKYDVITHIEEYDIDSKGYFNHPNYPKIFWTALIEQAYPKQATLKMKGYRKGEPIEFDVPLNQELKKHQKLIRNYFDEDPLYFVYGGFIFQELSLPYLSTVYGGKWLQNVPYSYFNLVNNELLSDLDPESKRVVILSRVIPSPITRGYTGVEGSIITHINGEKINDIHDLKSQLSLAPTAQSLGLHTLKLDREHQINKIVIDIEGAQKVNQTLQQRGLPLFNF